MKGQGSMFIGNVKPMPIVDMKRLRNMPTHSPQIDSFMQEKIKYGF